MGKEKRPVTNHFNSAQKFGPNQTIQHFVSYANQTCSSPFHRSVNLIKNGQTVTLGQLVVHTHFSDALQYMSQAKIVILAEKPGAPKRYNTYLEGFVKFSNAIKEIQRQYDLPCGAASQFNFTEIQEGLRMDSVSCEVIYFPLCFAVQHAPVEGGPVPELFLQLTQAFECLKVAENTPLIFPSINADADEDEEQPTSCLSRMFCCFK